VELSPTDAVTAPPRKSGGNGTRAWAVVTIVLAVLLVVGTYLVAFDAPLVTFLVRLYRDKHFLKATVRSWGWLAPVGFVAIQALQVIISPFPGEVTGPVGGALFGTTWGLIYSTVGLTIGTLLCFWMGRMWGEPLVRPFLSDRNWHRLNFIIEAEGAIICLILYLIPGFPKDIISYLFGISPMPFWLFAAVSTLGRLPGTWISSYFGANVGEQHYIWALVFIALMAAICLPIYYYRDRILAGLRLRARRRGKGLTPRREAQ
jgi:uncharacterized membrane protein YdjX (TVP38/TMEM64 family)